MDYARAIRIFRAARNITQNDIAKIVGCHESQISRLENGNRGLSLDMAQQIAKALEVPFDLFLLLSADNDEKWAWPPCSVEDGQRILSLLRGKLNEPSC